MEDQSRPDFRHEPVLVAEAIQWLGPALEDGGVLVDCTLGGGGHAEAFLGTLDRTRVVGLDQDSQALQAAGRRLARFGSRVQVIKANFSELASVLQGGGHPVVEAVFYDLGVSSFQLDRPERGFQYRAGAPIDMRMDLENPQTAADIVNNYSENELSDIIFRLGEERFARRVARAIVQRRQNRPFSDAGDLAEVVKQAIPAATRRTGPHPARRTFQALRIETNWELESLRVSLLDAVSVLKPAGRVAAISYHSLEDRIVKRTLVDLSRDCVCPPGLPVCSCEAQAQLRLLSRKPIRPSAEEIGANPRADSARMRVAEKLMQHSGNTRRSAG